MEPKKEEKIIMYDSPEAATYRTNLEGWVSGGLYWGKGEQGEHMARYNGCTHLKCIIDGCTNIVAKRSYTVCDSCRNKMEQKRYQALPCKEYDGSPVCLRDGEKYFFSEQDILDYIEDLQDQGEEVPDVIDLIFCEENHYYPIRTDYWQDNAPEDWDGELPKAMQEALDHLNEVISQMPPQSYGPGKVRTYYNVPKGS